MYDFESELVKCIDLGVASEGLKGNLDDLLKWYFSIDKEPHSENLSDLFSRYAKFELQNRTIEIIDRLAVTGDVEDLFPKKMDLAQCRKRYLSLMRIFHPDRGVKDPEWLNHRSEIINSAFQRVKSELLEQPEIDLELNQVASVTSSIRNEPHNYSLKINSHAMRTVFGDAHSFKNKLMGWLLGGALFVLLMVSMSIVEFERENKTKIDESEVNEATKLVDYKGEKAIGSMAVERVDNTVGSLDSNSLEHDLLVYKNEFESEFLNNELIIDEVELDSNQHMGFEIESMSKLSPISKAPTNRKEIEKGIEARNGDGSLRINQDKKSNLATTGDTGKAEPNKRKIKRPNDVIIPTVKDIGEQEYGSFSQNGAHSKTDSKHVIASDTRGPIRRSVDVEGDSIENKMPRNSFAKVENVEVKPKALLPLQVVNSLLREMEGHYNEGDLTPLMHLFADDLEYGDSFGKKKLHDEYEVMFKQSASRTIRFQIFELDQKQDGEIAIKGSVGLVAQFRYRIKPLRENFTFHMIIKPNADNHKVSSYTWYKS